MKMCEIMTKFDSLVVGVMSINNRESSFIT